MQDALYFIPIFVNIPMARQRKIVRHRTSSRPKEWLHATVSMLKAKITFELLFFFKFYNSLTP